MPRTISVSEATYAPGEYGPFALNGFNENNTDLLEVVMTVVDWPTADPLFEMYMRWEEMPETRFVVPWVSGQTDKYGTPVIEARFRIGVPKVAAGKGPVNSAAIRFVLYAAATTAITVQAV